MDGHDGVVELDRRAGMLELNASSVLNHVVHGRQGRRTLNCGSLHGVTMTMEVERALCSAAMYWSTPPQRHHPSGNDDEGEIFTSELVAT